MIFTPALFVILLAISTASAAPTQTETQIQLSRRDSTPVRSLHPHRAPYRGSQAAPHFLCTQRSNARGAAELGAGVDEGLLSSPSTAAQLAAFSRIVPLDGSADAGVDVGADVGVEPIEQGGRNCGSSYGARSPRSRQENRRASKDDGRGAQANGSRHTLLTGPDEPPSGAEPHFDRPPL